MMRAHPITILLCSLAILLTSGCSRPKTEPQVTAEPIPWTRVDKVEVTPDTQSQQPSPQVAPATAGAIGPGSSQSEVIKAWGMPDYIHDSAEDPQRKIWQYSHALVLFQGTKVQMVLPRR